MNPEQIYQSALYALPQAMCICDGGGRVLFMNSAARSLTGWQEESGLVDMIKTPGRLEFGGRSYLCTLSQLQDEGDTKSFLAILRSPDEENAIYDRSREARILAGAALATNQLLITEEMDLALNQSLEFLGCSSNVDRVYIFTNYDTDDGDHRCKLSYDWTRTA